MECLDEIKKWCEECVKRIIEWILQTWGKMVKEHRRLEHMCDCPNCGLID